jgi:hypothetical protein
LLVTSVKFARQKIFQKEYEEVVVTCIIIIPVSDTIAPLEGIYSPVLFRAQIQNSTILHHIGVNATQGHLEGNVEQPYDQPSGVRIYRFWRVCFDSFQNVYVQSVVLFIWNWGSARRQMTSKFRCDGSSYITCDIMASFKIGARFDRGKG